MTAGRSRSGPVEKKRVVSDHTSVKLRDECTCLHCWSTFRPEQILWVSEHRDLLGDPLLGAEQQQRFLPSRFTVEGEAVDARGAVCHSVACPKCHLTLPRAIAEFAPLFVSVLGSPACGKSYFLAAMTWSLRKTLPSAFRLIFTDTDVLANHHLVHYEETLFLNERAGEPVALSDLIAKTHLNGDLYNTVRVGQQTITYPRPFAFLLQPNERHPRYAAEAAISRVVCVYDNAGEHFLPGHDTANEPGTRHLAKSSILLFLFDPTQDRRLDKVINKGTESVAVSLPAHGFRQEMILREAVDRVRRHLHLTRGEKHDKPLFVVVTKADVWGSLLACDDWADPWTAEGGTSLRSVDTARIDETSRSLRSILHEHVPELVSTAESFANVVRYIPVSALGSAPDCDNQGRKSIRPAEIRPKWVCVPLLRGLAMITQGLVTEGTVAAPTPSR
jgi:hypothetical protein